MFSQDQINNFVREKTGIEDLKLSDDLHNDHGVSGDDFHELIDEYAKRFCVDMTLYLWYFHAYEEGSWISIGGSIFKPPYKRVPHIPLTPAILFEIARKGYWTIEYPAHELPRQRWDIIINQIFVVACICGALYSCLK